MSTGLMPGLLASCSTYPVYEAAITGKGIRVPLGLFAKTDMTIIRSPKIDGDIALLKREDGTYLALLMRCTHADNGLTFTGSGFHCSLHGSTFDGQGRVTHGPAQLPLRQFAAEVSGGEVIILTRDVTAK